jgi:DNA-binding transcriptional ArsR family regulator
MTEGGRDGSSTPAFPAAERHGRVPATSTQLAHILGQSLGTVSKHLAVLRDAGTVVGTRVGRSVTYRLAEQGHQLLQLLDASQAANG